MSLCVCIESISCCCFFPSLSGHRYLTRLVIQLNLTGGTLDLIHPCECINGVVKREKKKKKKMQSLQSVQKIKKWKITQQQHTNYVHHTCSLVGSQCALLHERIPTSCGWGRSMPFNYQGPKALVDTADEKQREGEGEGERGREAEMLQTVIDARSSPGEPTYRCVVRLD